jgi:hypothetical protein
MAVTVVNPDPLIDEFAPDIPAAPPLPTVIVYVELPVNVTDPNNIPPPPPPPDIQPPAPPPPATARYCAEYGVGGTYGPSVPGAVNVCKLYPVGLEVAGVYVPPENNCVVPE